MKPGMPIFVFVWPNANRKFTARLCDLADNHTNEILRIYNGLYGTPLLSPAPPSHRVTPVPRKSNSPQPDSANSFMVKTSDGFYLTEEIRFSACESEAAHLDQETANILARNLGAQIEPATHKHADYRASST
jgi:hypothetical protein